MGSKGIRGNGVALGPVWIALEISGGQTQEKIEKFGEETTLGRPGQPAELASIFVQLADNSASFTTGHIYGAAGRNGQP
nr:SDR family oxidoreductase [Chryseobacterium sp. G0162]